MDLWSLFEEHDVDVISLREKFDTSMPTGEAMVQLIMVFAQLERRMTAERTYSIMRGPGRLRFMERRTHSWISVQAK